MSSHESSESTYEIYTHTLTEMRDLLIDLKNKDEDIHWQEKAEALEKELNSLKKNKNYWLFWKEKREEFDIKTKDSLPVLTELTDLAITQDATPAHVIIEGDNYHVLSVLSYTHQWQVDVIYIDPPYNTGNKDFIYNDHYVDREDSFRHSKWLSFMEKRLTLARDLMKDTGVIFISIDDNEHAQLKLLCDEVFGEDSFIGNINWKRRVSSAMADKKFSTDHEYVLCYGKIWFMFEGISKSFSGYKNPDADFRWPWISDNLTVWMGKTLRPNQFYPIIDPITGVSYPPNPNRVWAYIPESMNRLIAENRIIFPTDPKKRPMLKRFQNELKTDMNPVSSWLAEIGLNSEGSREIQDIFWVSIFQYSKPRSLIEYLIKSSSHPNSLILDFFAGSGTTGHAVLALNREDGGNRRFILCSNRENTTEFPDKNICRDITYERVRRVATGYTNSKWVDVAWLGGNIRYLQAEFIPKHKWTDNIRNRMVERCSEMLCLRENIWEQMSDISTREMRFYQRGDRYLAILFWLFCFEEFSDILRSLDRPISIYVFSRGQMTRDDFEGITVPYTVEEIPDPILAIYKIIFWL